MTTADASTMLGCQKAGGRRAGSAPATTRKERSFLVKSVCLFCGSSEGIRPVYAEVAQTLGADAALAAGGEVVGVIPKALFEKEIGHEGLTELRVVGSMHERKMLMADLADGFVALPGGYGTLEGFMEVLSWAQLSIHEKPCALLNVGGFFEPLLHLFDRAVEEGFVHPDHRSLVIAGQEPENLLDAMEGYSPPKTKKWVTPGEL